MTTHFITLEVDLQENPQALQQEIETELAKKGESLRWAITRVNEIEQKAEIEAIVTTKE